VDGIGGVGPHHALLGDEGSALIDSILASVRRI